MLLAIDVGNTNTVIGLDAGDGSWQAIWRFSTIRSSLGADWAPTIIALATRDRIELKAATGVCLASVVPAATTGLKEFCTQWLGIEPLIVSSNLALNVALAMDQPHEVGADRIANAVAVREIDPGPAIVVDLGTATKVEAIDRDGVFRGGAIAVGIGVAIEAISARAARLFPIEVTLPKSAIGTNTADALQAGIVLGHRHMIQGLVADMRDAIGQDATVYFTGGHSYSLGTDFVPGSIHEPDLTLNGTRAIWHLSQV
jgi:type III pantothenate kinase